MTFALPPPPSVLHTGMTTSGLREILEQLTPEDAADVAHCLLAFLNGLPRDHPRIARSRMVQYFRRQLAGTCGVFVRPHTALLAENNKPPGLDAIATEIQRRLKLRMWFM